MTDNMPDFDSMSPEEIMAWMETLAKRQGASSEGFTTAADMDIAEIDPDTVVIDEPGYVPYGQEAPVQPQAVPARPAAVPPPEPPRPSVPLSVPIEPPRPPAPPPIPVEPERPVMQPAAQQESLFAQPAEEQGSLAWLESLAADQDDSLFNLDLSGLADEIPEAVSPAVDPVSWLEDLARSQGEMPATQTPNAPQPAESDSLTWLESLARRQGANPEEFTTAADMAIPAPPEEVEAPAYTPFSFDTPTTHRQPPAPEPLKLDNPASFLDSLAAEHGYSEEGVRATQRPPEPPAPEPAESDLSLEGIQQAISQGTVTPEQMQVFLEHETDFALQAPEEPLLEDYDPDAPPIPAELPDWLLEQVGPPPAAEAQPESTPAASQQPQLEQLIDQASALDDMPDWLKADMTSVEDVDLESIFAQTKDETQLEMPLASAPAQPSPLVDLEIDPNDPWAEAFDSERELGAVNVDEIPEWYEQNIHDPDRIAAVDRIISGEPEAPDVLEDIAAEAIAAVLSAEPLPEETVLPAGVPQAIPDWMPVFEPAAAAAAPVVEAVEAAAESQPIEEDLFTADMPDWLKEAMEVEEEIPDIFTNLEPAAQVPAPEPVVIVPPAPAAPRPAAPIAASLEAARASSQGGDIETSLSQYEALVRGSIELETVVEDLSHLALIHKGNPAVYRVLGDGLMRQGKLQAALDTYRAALNQL